MSDKSGQDHPLARRWISRDPTGEIVGVDLYAYVAGEPIGGVDPYGLWTLSGSAYDIFGGSVSISGHGFQIISISFTVGIGVGASVDFNPWGAPPDANASPGSNSIGVVAAASGGLGPIAGGIGWNYGGTQDCHLHWHQYGGVDPEVEGGQGEGGWPFQLGGLGAEGNAHAGVQVTHYF